MEGNLSLATLYAQSNLTKLQLLYWVGQQLRPDTPIFNTVQTYTIEGEVNSVWFQQSFQALVQHSDALRTTVAEMNGIPQQTVHETLDVELELLDLSKTAVPHQAFTTWLATRKQQPLDLNRCLFDTALIKLTADQWIWYFNQHHIMIDAHSSQLLYQKLADLYALAAANQPLSLGELPSFATYTAQEKAYGQSPAFEKDYAFWAKKLATPPDPINFYGVVPHKLDARVERRSLSLDQATAEAILATAKQKGIYAISEDMSVTNLFGTLFFALLHTMSGNSRLGAINPVHNRVSPQAQETLGLLMEMCPMQVTIGEKDSFRSVVQKLHRETAVIMPRARHGSSISLPQGTFDAMFNFHHFPPQQLGDHLVQQDIVHSGFGSDSFALHVHHFPAENSYRIRFDFHTAVFPPEKRAQTLALFEKLLAACLEDSEQSIVALAATLNKGQPEKTAVLPKPALKAKSARDMPNNLTQYRLRQIWEAVLDVSPIGVHDNFFELGGSSWQALKLFSQISEQFEVELPLSTLLQAGTIEKLGQLIEEMEQGKPWSSLVPIKPEGDKRPFFCVHGAGGHVLVLAPLADQMDDDQPFYAFQAKGLDGRQKPLGTIEAMAAHYITEMQKIQPAGPYLIGGFSMGGAVVYEMACQLQKSGHEVALVAILDTPAPSPRLKRLRQGVQLASRMTKFSPQQQDKLYLRLRDYNRHLDYLAKAGWQNGVTHLSGGAKQLWRKVNKQPNQAKASRPSRKKADIPDWIPQPKGDEHGQLRQVMFMNHMAYRKYTPAPFAGCVRIFKSIEGFGDKFIDLSDDLMGWGNYISGDVVSFMVPGNHQTMMLSPNVEIVGQHLKACLQQIQSTLPV